MLRPYLETIAGTADRFAVMDCEMTGFGEDINHLIEVAIIQLDLDGHIIDVWESLIRSPDGSVGDAETQHVHKISKDMIANAPSFSDISADIAGRLDGACLIGFGLRFDIAFLKAAPCPEFTFREGKFAEVGRACQMKFDLACHAHNVKVSNRHSALGDTAATAVLFFRKLSYWINGKPRKPCKASSSLPEGGERLWLPRGGYDPAEDVNRGREYAESIIPERHPLD